MSRMSPSQTLREIERLEKIDAKLEAAMKGLDKFRLRGKSPNIELSLEEVSVSIGRSRAWVVDAIQCLRIDSGLDAQEV